MYRWHKELPLLQSRLKMDKDSHKGHDCECELGMFRKVHPLRCPHSRKRGTGGCKAHKNAGNGKAKYRFSDLKKLEAARESLVGGHVS